jgi:hypothetical protein
MAADLLAVIGLGAVCAVWAWLRLGRPDGGGSGCGGCDASHGSCDRDGAAGPTDRPA